MMDLAGTSLGSGSEDVKNLADFLRDPVTVLDASGEGLEFSKEYKEEMFRRITRVVENDNKQMVAIAFWAVRSCFTRCDVVGQEDYLELFFRNDKLHGDDVVWPTSGSTLLMLLLMEGCPPRRTIMYLLNEANSSISLNPQKCNKKFKNALGALVSNVTSPGFYTKYVEDTTGLYENLPNDIVDFVGRLIELGYFCCMEPAAQTNCITKIKSAIEHWNAFCDSNTREGVLKQHVKGLRNINGSVNTRYGAKVQNKTAKSLLDVMTEKAAEAHGRGVVVVSSLKKIKVMISNKIGRRYSSTLSEPIMRRRRSSSTNGVPNYILLVHAVLQTVYFYIEGSMMCSIDPGLSPEIADKAFLKCANSEKTALVMFCFLLMIVFASSLGERFNKWATMLGTFVACVFCFCCMSKGYHHLLSSYEQRKVIGFLDGAAAIMNLAVVAVVTKSHQFDNKQL
mmetsp:Transcript_16294/g.26556  ORF Transcript_16294/g.26556 Transcript_16294/m.26556 type:complete len:452 (+) Transcript_16294:167-1522(+)